MAEFADLPFPELLKEIEREEEALATKRRDLASAEARRNQILSSIEEEQLVRYEERVRARAGRIGQVESVIAERADQLGRFESRLLERAEEIVRLEDRVRSLEARLRLPFISPTERFITRETIRSLEASIRAYRGWQTRDTSYLEMLRRAQERDLRTVRGLRSWQIREEPLYQRLLTLREELRDIKGWIETLQISIGEEEDRLEEKRKLIVELEEATCYCNYIRGMKGGEGKDREYKILKWIPKGTVNEHEDQMRNLWSRIFFFVDQYVDLEDVQYGVTNREDTLEVREWELKEDYVCAIIIDSVRIEVTQAGEGSKKQIEAVELVTGDEAYNLMDWYYGRNALGSLRKYHNPPSVAYKGMKV